MSAAAEIRQAIANAARRLRWMPPRCEWRDDDDQQCTADAVVSLPEFADAMVCAEHDEEFSAGARREPIRSS